MIVARIRSVHSLDNRDLPLPGGSNQNDIQCDGLEAVALIHEHRPHVVFLDVQMPGLDGFEVLRSLDPTVAPVTIFATAYDRYAVAAFEAQALDYLLKPFSDERFESALEHAVRSIRTLTASDRRLRIESVLEERSAVNLGSGYLDRIVVKENGRVALLNVDEIDWIGAAGFTWNSALW